MYKVFFRYVIPSMLAFALSGVYAIVDGFFVGNSLGDEGLAAVNLAYPLTAFLQAAGTGVGMAGAIHYAIYDGAGRENERNRYLWISLAALAVVSLLLMLLYAAFSSSLLRAFGAEGELFSYSSEYMRYISLGAFFQVLGTGLVPFIRNMGSALYAMLAMIAGFLTNIALDYLLVWVIPYGLAGAALATVIGQGVTMLLCVIFLIRKRKMLHAVWDLGWEHQLFNILKLGPSPFGLTFVPNITLILVNRSAIFAGGESAVSTYAVISYVSCVVLLLLQGISDGCQPLISLHYGERDISKVNKVRSIAYVFAFFTAAVCVIGLYFSREQAAVLFGASREIAHLVKDSFLFFLPGFLFVSISRITISYFYAAEKTKLSYLLIYGEPLLLFVLLLFAPEIWGMNGVWLSVVLSQIMSALAALLLMRYAAKGTKDKAKSA